MTQSSINKLLKQLPLVSGLHLMAFSLSGYKHKTHKFSDKQHTGLRLSDFFVILDFL